MKRLSLRLGTSLVWDHKLKLALHFQANMTLARTRQWGKHPGDFYLASCSDQPDHLDHCTEADPETPLLTRKILILSQRTLGLHYIKSASSICWERTNRQQNEEAVYHQAPDLVIYIPEFKDLLPISPTKESVLCPEKYIWACFNTF